MDSGPREDTSRPSGAAASRFRPEIEGLRSIAVLSVVIFHIWPEQLSGGYVGVDIFFVISGFLITRNLMSEVDRTDRLSLWNFYVRRFRRLMPVALLVLTLVALFGYFLPPQRWDGLSKEIFASAFYFENWWLAAQSVNYLQANEAASPVRHYWSLSIEEQFYIFWPVMVWAGAALLRHRQVARRWFIPACVIAIFLVSLWYSVTLTRSDPTIAYFVTHARIWELALGAIIALFRPMPIRIGRAADVIAGLAIIAMLGSAYVYDANTAFPGSAALVPTVACALVILFAAPERSVGPYALLACKPARYIGSTSYSQYLWHWPLIIFFIELTGSRPTLAQGILLLQATLILSHFSKIWIEDRYRIRGSHVPKGDLKVLGGAVMACVVAAASIQVTLFVMSTQLETSEPTLYPGAAAFTKGAVVEEAPTRPGFAYALKDNPEIYARGCHLPLKDVEPKLCRFNEDGRFTVFLIGDSHAASWQSTLKPLAFAYDFQLVAATKSACPLVMGDSALHQKMSSHNPTCAAFAEKMADIIQQENPRATILTQAESYAYGDATPSEINVGLRTTLKTLAERAGKVVVVRDVIHWPEDPVDCAERDPDCAVPIEETRRDREPLFQSSQSFEDALVIDMTDSFCSEGKCPAIVGNVLVWRDEHHFTQTYGQTMQDALAEKLAPVIGDRPRLDGTAPASRDMAIALDCDATARTPKLNFSYVGTLEDGQLTMTTGEEGVSGFERWEGVIDEEGQLVIEGQYIQGLGGLKPLHYTAERENGIFVGGGKRGGRYCRFVGRPL